ncbi:cation-transporting P-type ATPase [Streptomyces sp. NPDC014744]|uniref:cation-transporting P-type ATPase n=1 Tax=Streptomyces sp. NPDC014744 TaxID=3364903 RepID=UPI0036FFA395
MTSGEGLSEAEAATRFARYGPNMLAQDRPHVLRAVLGKLWGRCRGCWRRRWCWSWRRARSPRH